MSLAETIKNEARRLGFALAGVTGPEPPPHWPVFKNWLEMGRHASMHYLTDPRRADPSLVFPECKSILVLGISYPKSRISPDTSKSIRGRVASYAWGKDYHIVIKEKLGELGAFIERKAGVPVLQRGYTDTGPILERDLAQRAGLGWIGKNTCLIHPGLGSFFFLAELLLDIDLERDEPFTADRCGTCQRCILACPTGCILPDRTLDTGRCISYLTIENKEQIPLDLRPSIDNWIFGCDVCQDVCPWNKRSIPVPDPAFLPPDETFSEPDLIAEMKLTSQEFNRKFKESPLLRARRTGYLRNIAVALGNSLDMTAISALEQASMEENLIISGHAEWAMTRIKEF